jgi:hypothetical protein
MYNKKMVEGPERQADGGRQRGRPREQRRLYNAPTWGAIGP